VKLTLFDLRGDLRRAWEDEFRDFEDVVARTADLSELEPHDCLVSPANSFGIMDGGIDLAISSLIPGLQERVSARVYEEWLGEQPVGTSMLVATGFERFPWLGHTPTMRAPRPIAAEVVYDAMRALLLAVRRHNVAGDRSPIRSIACPGLGTATGRVAPAAAARMMRLAYESVVAPERGPYRTWAEVGPRLGRQ
jgi:O-acetyl-ADP-ribose deacetylase (regulator of RNase III)